MCERLFLPISAGWPLLLPGPPFSPQRISSTFPPFELCRTALKVEMKVAQSCLTLCDPHGLYSPWNSPGQNTGVGSHSILQGIFPTQGSNPGLPDCRSILYQLSHQESPRHFYLCPTLVYGTFLVLNFCWALIDWAPINYTETLVLMVTLGGSGRRQWHPTPVFLPGKSHWRRSLVGCSPWGCEESDTTEWLHFHFSLSCIGEGNGNPLQCSCLENPRAGGAWWAAVSGVT